MSIKHYASKYDSVIYMTPIPSYNLKKSDNHIISSAQSWRSIQWPNIQKAFQSEKVRNALKLVFRSDVFSVSLTSWHCARYPDLCDYCSVSSSPLSLFLFVEVCPAQGWWVFRKQSKKFTRTTTQNSWAKCFIKFTQSHIQIFKGKQISVIIKLTHSSLTTQSLTSSPCQADIHI